MVSEYIAPMCMAFCATYRVKAISGPIHMAMSGEDDVTMSSAGHMSAWLALTPVGHTKFLMVFYPPIVASVHIAT